MSDVRRQDCLWGVIAQWSGLRVNQEAEKAVAKLEVTEPRAMAGTTGMRGMKGMRSTRATRAVGVMQDQVEKGVKILKRQKGWHCSQNWVANSKVEL